MPATEQMLDLIDTLLRKTRENALKWKTSVDDETFRLESNAANLRLSRSKRWDADEEREFTNLTLTVLDSLSRIVEEYRPETSEECERMEELYALARRSALQTEKVLDKLLDELQSAGK
jgi:hypothetical protein